MSAGPLDLASHEFCWGGFLLVVILKAVFLGERVAPLPILLGWAAMAAGFIFAVRQTRVESESKRRWGWAYYAVAMNLSFMLLGPTIKAVSDWRADVPLQRIDAALIGRNLSLRMEPWHSPALNDAMSLGYLFFMVLLFCSLVYYLLWSPHLARCYRGLFSVYGLGFAGYTLIPAAGPYVALKEQFPSEIAGGWLTALNNQMVATGSNQVDVFPSLHIAVSTFLWLSLLLDHRKLAWSLTPILLLLWVSTPYLRYHYFIDVAAGFALALLVFTLTARRERPRSTACASAAPVPLLRPPA
jgi:hypothetical protein